MRLDVNVTGAQAVRAQLLRIGEAASVKALAATAEDVEEYIGNEAGRHTKTGALFRSVYKRKVGDGWEIGHDSQVAPHALFVHWGTKAHKIRPKGRDNGGKSILRFPVAGRFVFAREVNHPGYRGDPWLVRAAAQAPLIFARHVDAAVARINSET